MRSRLSTMIPSVEFLLLMTLGSAWASQPTTTHAPEPCAVVESTVGSSQILDPTRTRVDEAEKGASVACEGWVLGTVGHVTLKHRDGYRLTVSGGSFVQLPENNTDGRYSSEGLILFRGQVLIRVPQGSPKFQAITPDGRVRMANSTAILIYSTAEEDTQLISLEGKSSLENRFQPDRRVTADPGEATLISRKTLRTVPSAPKAMSLASLRAKVDEFGVKGTERAEFLERGRTRAERVFVSAEFLKPKSSDGRPLPDEVELPVHKKASGDPVSKLRKVAQTAVRTKEVQKHLARRLAGGHPDSEEIVFPSQFHGKEGRVEVQIEDVAAKFDRERGAVEDRERKRLIEELSHIQPD